MSSVFQAVIHFLLSGLEAEGPLAQRLCALGVAAEDLGSVPCSLDLGRELRMLSASNLLGDRSIESVVAEAKGIADLLAGPSGACATVEAVGGPGLGAVLAEVRTISAQPSDSLSLGSVQAVRDDARAIASAVAERLGRLERDAATDVLHHSLEEAGYDVQLAVGGSTSALWAEKGDRVVAAVVGPSGAVEMDLAGHDGASCVNEINTVLGRVAVNGGIVSQVSRDFHGDPEGASLIPAAGARARRDDLSRVEALLAEGEPVVTGHERAARRRVRRVVEVHGP